MKSHRYDSWPLGPVPAEKSRNEIEELRASGYVINDPRDAVTLFEKKISEFTGAKYCALVDCCTHALLLSLRYLIEIGELTTGEVVEIPAQTYGSVPMVLKQLNLVPKLVDSEWKGLYQVGNTRVWDAAVRWTEGMYVGDNSLQALSFQMKKRVPIGKGGAIITDDREAVEWIKLASYDGRDLSKPYTDPEHFRMVGYHYYMTPEDAARGIILMDKTPRHNEDSAGNCNYPDLREYSLFREPT